jgi:glycosyltransferase involved in cell wall biosynthesis
VTPQNDIVISNGFNKFHLAFAAERLAAEGRLGCLMTGGYPARPIKKLIKSLSLDRRPPLRRLLDREVAVPSRLIRSYWLSEILQHAELLRRFPGLMRRSEDLSCIGMRAYARRAATDLKRFASSNGIYHYRAGFGGPSVELAKTQGLVALCDHSIAHPKLVDWLSSGGDENEKPAVGSISEFWRLVLDDIERADHVLVNSDFVKHTFRLAGANTSNVHVVYLGVDDEFARALTIEDIAALKANRPDSVPSIMFAGAFDRRKGATEVIEALQQIWELNWCFSIAGTVDREIISAHRDFFASSRVRRLGWIPRPELARVMAAADVFLFPSRAEGSARVVFEALASGCFVVTTANSGSIVVDGTHGSIVPPRDSAAIGRALAGALADIAGARRIGMQNATLVRSQFTQSLYGRSLEGLYAEIASERR